MLYVFSQGRAIPIPIPITTIGMRLPHDRIVGKRVAASNPQALGMDANDRLRLNTYFTLGGWSTSPAGLYRGRLENSRQCMTIRLLPGLRRLWLKCRDPAHFRNNRANLCLIAPKNYPAVLMISSSSESISAYLSLSVTAIFPCALIGDCLLRAIMQIIFGTQLLNSVMDYLGIICKYTKQMKSAAFENFSLDGSTWNMVKYFT